MRHVPGFYNLICLSCLNSFLKILSQSNLQISIRGVFFNFFQNKIPQSLKFYILSDVIDRNLFLLNSYLCFNQRLHTKFASLLYCSIFMEFKKVTILLPFIFLIPSSLSCGYPHIFHLPFGSYFDDSDWLLLV